MHNDNKNFVGGMVVGSLIGVVLGILVAPDSGVKTRQKLKSKLFGLKEYLTDEVEKVAEKVKSVSAKSKLIAKRKKSK